MFLLEFITDESNTLSPLKKFEKGVRRKNQSPSPLARAKRSHKKQVGQRMEVSLLMRPKATKLLKTHLERKKIKALAKTLLSVSECESSELSLLLTDDLEIAELNEHYRGKVGPTDVLSFAMQEGEGAEHAVGVLGDVVISVETALRQSQEQGVSFEDEFLRLLIHGFLHLLGYDHENVSDSVAAKMRKREEELFLKLRGLI